MEKLSRLFQGRNKSLEDRLPSLGITEPNGGRTGVAFSREDVRLVILRDQGPDRRVLLYDSVLEDRKRDAEKPVQKTGLWRCRGQKAGLASPSATSPVNATPMQSKQPTHQSSEHKLLGEMMYGGIPMTDHEEKKCAFKVHTTKDPSQILLTQVFVPSKFLSNRESANSDQEPFDSLSIHSMTGENTPAQRISGGENTNPSLALSVPMAVPTPPKKETENEDSGISGSVPSSLSTPHLSPGDSSSSINSNSFNSLKRRFKRNRSTSLENLRTRSDDSECTPVNKRPPKYGMCIAFSLPEPNSEAFKHFELFFFSHITLIEFHMNKLKSAVEQGLTARNKEKATEALDVFRASICDLYMAPRLSQPVWLNMMASTSHRMSLCHAFMKEFMTLVTKFDTKSAKFFVSNLITAVLCHHLAWVPTVTPAGATPARTYFDKHSAKWLDALAKSHPYNPLWAQLSDAYGAVGFPLRQARTVVTGRKEDVVRRVLYVLSYFLRCSDVAETDVSRDVANDTCWLETTTAHRSMTPIIESLQSRNNSTSDMEAFLRDSVANAGKCPNCMRELKASTSGNCQSDCGMSVCEACSIMLASTSSDKTFTCDKSCHENLITSSRLCVSSTTLKSAGSGETLVSDESAQTRCTVCACSHLDHSKQDGVEAYHRDSNLYPVLSEELDNCSKPQPDLPESAAMLYKAQSHVSLTDSDSSHPCADPVVIHAKVSKLFRGPENHKCMSDDDSDDSSVVKSDLTENVGEEVFRRIDSDTGSTVKEEESVIPGPITEGFLHKSPALENIRLLGRAAPVGHCQNQEFAKEVFEKGDLSRSDSEIVAKQNTSLSEEDRQAALLKMKSFRDSFSYNRSNSLFDDYFKDGQPVDTEEIQSSCLLSNGEAASSSSTVQKGGAPFPASLKSSESSLSICDEYFKQESPPLSTECAAQDMVTSTISLMKQLPHPEAGDDASLQWQDGCEEVRSLSQTGARQRRTSGGSQGPSLSRQTSTQSTVAPVRCRSVTPTELSLRRFPSCPSAALDAADNNDMLDSLHEIPMPCCDESEDGKTLMGFESNLGRSLLGGYANHYMSDFVLHGTSASQFHFMDKLHSDLTMAVQNPVLDEPIAEAVCIVADTDNCTVRLLTSQYTTSDRVTHHELSASHLVAGIVESVHDLWKLKMSPEFCLMHMEDRLQEIYFKSCTLAQFVKTRKIINHKELSTCLGVDVSDIPLLLAVAGTHTPQLALGLL